MKECSCEFVVSVCSLITVSYHTSNSSCSFSHTFSLPTLILYPTPDPSCERQMLASVTCTYCLYVVKQAFVVHFYLFVKGISTAEPQENHNLFWLIYMVIHL